MEEVGKSRRKLRGRPKTTEVADIRARCEECFNKGMGIMAAAEETNLNRNTVSAYYIEFREKLVETMDKNFINEQRTAKFMALQKLDQSIKDMDDFILLTKHQLGEGPKYSGMYSVYLKALEDKTELEQARYAIEMTPTIDIDYEKVIQQSQEKIANAIKSVQESARTNA